MDTKQYFISTIKEETDQDDTRNFHTCDFCFYSTNSFPKMVSHLNRHHSVKCPSKFFECTESSLEAHKCDSCDFETHLKVDLCTHNKMTHDSEAINQRVTFSLSEVWKCLNCRKCSFQTYSKLVLMGHDTKCRKTKSKNSSKWLTCEQCIFKTKDIRGLQVHIAKKHKNLKNTNFKSEIRSYKNVLSSQISSGKFIFIVKNKHKVRRRTPNISKKIKWRCCEQCSYKSDQPGNLKRHIRIMHTAPEDIKWFECDNCSYKGKLKGNLQKHIVSQHTAWEHIKWLDCEHCTYRAKSKREIKIHMLSKHTAYENIKWFECEYCSYKAKFMASLKSHLARKHAAPKIST